MLPPDNTNNFTREAGMTKTKNPSITNHFEGISDPRKDNKRHKLIDIMTIAICAVICNADSFEHIAELSKESFPHLKLLLSYAYGTPRITQEIIEQREEPLRYTPEERRKRLKELIESGALNES